MPDHDWSTEAPDRLTQCSRCALYRERPVLPTLPYHYTMTPGDRTTWTSVLPSCVEPE